jgi:hypothetical protein
VVNPDIDRLRVLVGGWRERFGEIVAAGPGRYHMCGGWDVIMPQYMGRLGVIAF